MPGVILAEGLAIVIDLSAAGVGAVDNLVQIINSQGPISAASSSASLIASVTAPIPGVGALTNTVSLTLTLVKGAAYADEDGASLADYVSAVGSVVSIVGSLLAIATPLGWTALGIAAVGSVLTGIGFGLNLRDLRNSQSIDPTTNTDFYNATRARPVPRDPLAIDLDGDGIETVGIVQGSPVLFDHDADGTRTGTGWLQGDDAWLVLDRNGNGVIDTGRELFGVDTLISGTPGVNAVYARNGFEALSTLDANGDRVFNASDAAFTQVRLWRDLNQDGISQAGELSTLSSQNITGIGLTPSTTVTNLGNGNRINGTATVTRGNGTTTTAAGVGVNTTAANLDLANNPFYREFTTPVTLTTLAQDLPQMQGSGWVRDLREAMSLGTPESEALVAKMQEFAAASTHTAQMALLDGVIRAWAATNQTQALAPVDDPSRRFVLTGDAATSALLQAYIPLLEIFNGVTVEQAGMQAPTVQGTVRNYNMPLRKVCLVVGPSSGNKVSIGLLY